MVTEIQSNGLEARIRVMIRAHQDLVGQYTDAINDSEVSEADRYYFKAYKELATNVLNVLHFVATGDKVGQVENMETDEDTKQNS